MPASSEVVTEVSTDLPQEAAEAAPAPVSVDLPVAEEPSIPAAEAAAPETEASNTVDSDIVATEPVPAATPAPEPVAVVLTPIDPDRPKRAGWWSRTKAALTGD